MRVCQKLRRLPERDEVYLCDTAERCFAHRWKMDTGHRDEVSEEAAPQKAVWTAKVSDCRWFVPK